MAIGVGQPVLGRGETVTMQILLNGKPFVASGDDSIAALLDQLGLAGKRIAVEVNEEIVPRGVHATYILNANDRVEIVHAIGGG